jgi:hypothetical protein
MAWPRKRRVACNSHISKPTNALSFLGAVARGEQPNFSPEQAPDVVRVLLERLVQLVPTAAHRRALEVCAHADDH